MQAGRNFFPEVAKPLHPVFRPVAGDERCVDGANGNAGHPFRLLACGGQRLIGSCLIGTKHHRLARPKLAFRFPVSFQEILLCLRVIPCNVALQHRNCKARCYYNLAMLRDSSPRLVGMLAGRSQAWLHIVQRFMTFQGTSSMAKHSSVKHSDDMEEHRNTYSAFIKGSVALSIVCGYVLVALVSFRFAPTFNVFMGFGGLILGIVAVFLTCAGAATGICRLGCWCCSGWSLPQAFHRARET